jgi:hypothetical protein
MVADSFNQYGTRPFDSPFIGFLLVFYPIFHPRFHATISFDILSNISSDIPCGLTFSLPYRLLPFHLLASACARLTPAADGAAAVCAR